jgi:hypothetical protein
MNATSPAVPAPSSADEQAQDAVAKVRGRLTVRALLEAERQRRPEATVRCSEESESELSRAEQRVQAVRHAVDTSGVLSDRIECAGRRLAVKGRARDDQ